MATKKITKQTRKDDMLAYIKELEAEKKALLKARKADVPEDVKTEGEVEEQSYSEEKEYVEIRPDKYIQVVSLCPNPLTISTAISGGKSFKFRKLGEMKRIIYQDLVDIMEVQPTFLEAGVFYISNRDVIRRHGLDEFYEKIITKDEMEQILSASDDTSFSIFRSANKRQQEYLVGMLVKRISTGEDIDRNFIHLVSEETGINIATKAEEEKKFKEILNEKD